MYTRYCILFLIILNISKSDSSAITNRIVGGTFAEEGKYPFILSLQLLTGDKYKHFCGASLIAKNWALTAAHCINGVSRKKLRVVAGITNLTETNGVTAGITKLFQKNYDADSYKNDISLLKLDRNILESKKVKIIKLEEKDNFEVRKCWVAGWGVQKEGSQTVSIRLKVTTAETISNGHCTDNFDKDYLIYYHPDSQICTKKTTPMSSSCQGDSGGPLFLSNNGAFTQIGVVSFGIGCGKYNDIDTRISSYIEWIKQTLKK